MPDHLAGCNIKEILLANLFAGWQLNEIHVGRRIVGFGGPKGNNVVGRRPLKVSNARGGQGTLIQQAHARCFKDGNQIFALTGQVLVVVRPFKGRRRWSVHALWLLPLLVWEKMKGSQQFTRANFVHFDGLRITWIQIVG